VRGHIGGFRIHRGQLSENLQEYRREQRSFSRPMTALDRLRCVRERLLMALPQRVSGTVADRSTLILYDHAQQVWRKTPYLNP
jgi:hypothetical protein